MTLFSNSLYLSFAPNLFCLHPTYTLTWQLLNTVYLTEQRFPNDILFTLDTLGLVFSHGNLSAKSIPIQVGSLNAATACVAFYFLGQMWPSCKLCCRKYSHQSGLVAVFGPSELHELITIIVCGPCKVVSVCQLYLTYTYCTMSLSLFGTDSLFQVCLYVCMAVIKVKK